MSSTDLPEENGSGELPSAAGGSRPAATEWCAAAVRLSCAPALADRKSTNSSHSQISYAVFCLKKKKKLRTREGRPARAPAGLVHPGGALICACDSVRGLENDTVCLPTPACRPPAHRPSALLRRGH